VYKRPFYQIVESKNRFISVNRIESNFSPNRNALVSNLLKVASDGLSPDSSHSTYQIKLPKRPNTRSFRHEARFIDGSRPAGTGWWESAPTETDGWGYFWAGNPPRWATCDGNHSLIIQTELTTLARLGRSTQEVKLATVLPLLWLYAWANSVSYPQREGWEW